MDQHFDTPHQRSSKESAIRGEDSSDSALSDVLDLTDNKGVLMIGKRLQQASLQSGAGVAQVGLGARNWSLSRHKSEQSLRGHWNEPDSGPAASPGPSASPGSDRLEIMRDAQQEAGSVSNQMARKQRKHHQRSSTMSRSMSELMAALDLEASEWGQRLGEAESMDLGNDCIDTAQSRESHLLDARPPASRVTDPSGNDSTQAPLPASDSMPSLSASSSQDHSIDDSRGPATADSSLVRSNSAKSLPSRCDSSETATDVGAGAEFRSIYDAYRHSNSTMASRFTAPMVRIEDPEGDEVDDSELEDDVSSSDDMPRKRNKQTQKNRLGFEEQRATLRPRPSIGHRSISSRPSQTFKATLNPTQEENTMTSAATSALAATTTSEGTDPYAFYEFSPSLPPFMPSGLSPRDLTGRGTWSSIVARASERMRSRQPSVASFASVSTSATGPVSMRQIRATARAKQKQVDAAHRAREEMSDQFATMSYRPFAIHDHAVSFASHAGMSTDLRASVSTVFGTGSPVEGMASGRSSSMSSLGYADSVAPSVGDYGSKWPVAIGADQGVGPDDAASMFTLTPWSLSRRPSVQQTHPKVYVEFSMQTSPQPSPTESNFPVTDSLTVDCAVNRVDAEVGRDVKTASDNEFAPSSASRMDYLGIDAPLRRRRSTASLLSAHNLDSELDQPGLWPSEIRAPRLSSTSRRHSRASETAGAAVGENVACEEGSDEESDLDVDADLEDLAERSGVLDESRGSKRKLHSNATSISGGSTEKDAAQRPIASIPARSRRISAALERIRAQRISRTTGWVSSDDDEDDAEYTPSMLTTPRKTATSGRPSLPGSAPAKVAHGGDSLRRSKSMASMSHTKREGSVQSASSSTLRVRSPSPDLSILTSPSDDEEILLTAEVEPHPAELSHSTILDEEFDMMVGQTITSRFTNPVNTSAKSKMRRDSSEANAALTRSASQRNKSVSSSGSSAEDGNESCLEISKDSQHTVQMQPRSRTSSMSSVIEIIQEADELLSSTGHSIGHSSGHDTNISDTGGTSGHDPQKSNHVLAEIIRRRMSVRLRGLQTPVTLARSRSSQAEASSVKDILASGDNADIEQVEDNNMSPNMQDTPDTMAGSEIWSSFHADRSSTASTATTWSYRSTDDALPRTRTISNTEPLSHIKKLAPSCASAGSPALAKEEADAAEQAECVASSPSVPSLPTAPLKPSATPAVPVLRRKSSGLPVGRATLKPKQSRPSLPLPTKSYPLSSTALSANSTSSGLPLPKPAMRRYQSVASLQTRSSDNITDEPAGVNVAFPKKRVSATKTAARAARYSDGHRVITPSKAICGVGGGITPSKLLSLRNAASTTSLRTKALTEQSVDTSPRQSIASGIPQSRLPTPSAVRTRLPTPTGAVANKI